jgi:hypothetical protein
MALTRIYGNLISSATLTGNIFQAQTITGNSIAVSTLTGNLIASATITGDKIGLTAITSNLVAAAAITGDKIGLTAITGNLIASTITLSNVGTGGATSFLSTVLESANVTTLMGANTTINISAPLVVFTANSSANSTVNFTGLAGMPVGNTASFVIINPNSSTAKYISAYQVDGSATTVKWAGGAPLGGSSANTDIYSFSVIKTSATPTYNVFASVQNFF